MTGQSAFVLVVVLCVKVGPFDASERYVSAVFDEALQPWQSFEACVTQKKTKTGEVLAWLARATDRELLYVQGVCLPLRELPTIKLPSCRPSVARPRV